MSIEKVKENINKVKQMKFGTSVGDSNDLDTLKQVRTVLSEYDEQIKKVWESDELTPTGKANKEREIKEQGAEALRKLVASFNSVKDKELDKAENAAKAIISKPVSKPDDFELGEWTRNYEQLKMDLIVYGTQAATQALVDLINDTSDPYLASIILDDFSELIGKLNEHYPRLTVQDIYTRLKQNAETDVKAEARELLKEVEALRRQSPINDMAAMAVDRTLGSEYRSLLEVKKEE